MLIRILNKKKLNTLWIIFGFTAITCINPNRVLCQNSSVQKLRLYQDTLQKLGKMVVNGADETDRKAATYRFIPTLVRALKLPGSFEFPFDSVKSIRIVYSPDRHFRIFSWFVNINEIGYRFYGAIQINNPNHLQLFPLVDYTENIKKPQDTVTNAKKWYGTEYYSILPVDPAGNYVLLGWKGFSDLITQRLIDVIHFSGDTPIFGAPIFKNGGKVQSRVIFSYTHQASMMLKYLPEKKMILFDHLSPPDSTMKGKFEFYGPDLSYDGFSFSDGFWRLQTNISLQNPITAQDSLFINPVKKPKIN
jgi:hypothetical protein